VNAKPEPMRLEREAPGRGLQPDSFSNATNLSREGLLPFVRRDMFDHGVREADVELVRSERELRAVALNNTHPRRESLGVLIHHDVEQDNLRRLSNEPPVHARSTDIKDPHRCGRTEEGDKVQHPTLPEPTCRQVHPVTRAAAQRPGLRRRVGLRVGRHWRQCRSWSIDGHAWENGMEQVQSWPCDAGAGSPTCTREEVLVTLDPMLTYAIITAARNEASNLPRLAKSLHDQAVRPSRWLIVENGSVDETAAVGEGIAAEHDWVSVVVLSEPGRGERGAPIVRSFEAGLAHLDGKPDIVVNVDADVTMEPDYFKRLLAEFERNPRLGIASGSAWELDGETWRQRFVTGGTVWGATRAYRWQCLQDVSPLERRHGWDGIDQLKARARDWQTCTFTDVPFRHHRKEGQRDGSTWAHWLANGDTAHFMGYSPWYLLVRTAHQMRRDPSALALLGGYLFAAARRSPRLKDSAARAMLRRDQSLRNIFRRRREALGMADPRDGEPLALSDDSGSSAARSDGVS